MAKVEDLVRPSRDGDQFHYHWASRRCLAMLGSQDKPVAVTVEGVPAKEGIAVSAGLDAIDVAEYYGSADISRADRVRYLQLKHSTRHAEKGWTASGLGRTLLAFGRRYAGLVDRFGAADVAQRFSFEFLTNRPIASSLVRALTLLQRGSDDPVTASLAQAIGLDEDRRKAFARLLTITGNLSDYIGQRNLLEHEAYAYLPERDRDAPLRLKDLVTRRATSEYQGRPEITRHDVLEALDASERDLFPAPNLIEPPSRTVDREQLPEIVAAIVAAVTPVILHADGGVGKSVLTTRLGAQFTEGSETFVYDCFGNGGYRSATEYRHRPRDGLVQLANEMAAKRLSDPLVPSQTADASSYLRAFKARLEQASAVLAARAPDALLTIMIDAADNAEMAAAEAHDGHSFAHLLLRETLPGNVRLLLTVRPHRASLLDPPANALEIKLEPFSEAETAELLRGFYPNASNHDVREFHRLTSQNPRVQTAALATGRTLREVLLRLGTTPLTVDSTIARLLEDAVAKLRFDAGSPERDRIDRVFTALVTLRPFVPLEIVASSADVPVSLVRSIANDLAHPLFVRDDSVQFRDEPTETWFRERFRLPASQLGAFIERLRPLAATSAYVASSLPQLMLAAGQFDALVTLALADADLPEEDALARRDVQLQRLQFAIKAAIRAGRHADAAALAMKAGREAAADTRQQRMLSAHTDLAGSFLQPEQMLEQVSRRLIRGGNWTGSDHAYEAAFLSGVPALHGDARSQLRIAFEWLAHWAKTPHQPHGGKRMQQADVAELGLATLNLHGAEACAAELRRWHSRTVSFAAGRIISARLVDAARFEELDSLALAAGNDIGLLLALCQEVGDVGRAPPRSAVERALRIAMRPGIRLQSCQDWRAERTLLETVLALIEAALAHRIGRRPELARLLERYLPKRPPELLRHDYEGPNNDRHIYLHGYALHAALRSRSLDADSYLAARKPTAGKKKQHRREHDIDSYETRHFLGALLPWHNLLAKAQLSRNRIAPTDLDHCLTKWRSHHHAGSRQRSRTADEIARVWSHILDDPRYDRADWDRLLAWRHELSVPLFIPTEITLARRAARRSGLAHVALELAAGAFAQVGGPDEDAESQIDSCVSIARAVFPVSLDEARAYFDRAVLLSSRVGEENVPSWESMLDLGATATRDAIDLPVTAYRFARAAELTYAHCARDKHFDWERSITTLAGLSLRLAPAQFSRWLDRRFGDENRYLPTLAEYQLERGVLSPALGVVLEAFAGNWDRAGLLKRALECKVDPAPAAVAATLLVRHARLDGSSVATWHHILATLDRHGMDTREALAGLATATRVEAALQQSAAPRRGSRRRQRTARDYSRLFCDLDPTSAADLAAAATRLKASKPPFEWRDFYATAMSLVPAGGEARFLDALTVGALPSLIGLRDVVDALPGDWATRAAVPPALAHLVRKLVRTNSRRVTLNTDDLLPWSRIQAICGLSKRDLAREAVAATGEQQDPLGANDLFRLVSLLAALMTPIEAQATMARALALYEPLFEPASGDGSWSANLLPPASSLGHVWAGYLWAALGAPEASRRWKAAHAVRRLAALGQGEVLGELVSLANIGEAGPFADARLRFYTLHAQLWLVIALARAAVENPHAIAPHAPWLHVLASIDAPHLLIRAFAARTLLALERAGALLFEAARQQHLEAMAAGCRAPNLPPPSHTRRQVAGTAERFVIDHDFQRHDIPALSRAFGISDQALVEAMQVVIREDWRLTDRGHWDEDARATRRLYPESDDGRTSQWTRCDNLNRYLSFHALHVAAGKLLAQRAEAPDFDKQAFSTWFRDGDLTFSDGRWHADRRQPVPLDLTVMPPDDEKSWPASPLDSDADAHLFPTRNSVTINAGFSRFAGRRRESVTIASALVCSDRGRALARAFRANPSPWSAAIPNFGDPAIDAHGFHFEGWIAHDRRDYGLDRLDPWAADLNTTMLAPADPYRLLLRIEGDMEQRVWTNAHGRVEMTATQWSEGVDGDMIRYGGGFRLLARQALLDALVKRTGMTLLVHVYVARDLVKLQYSLDRHEDVPDARTVTQVYLYEAGSGWWRPGSPPPARRRASGRTRP